MRAPQVEDPRTGEILRGHTILGSWRLRQTFLIAEALLAPCASARDAAACRAACLSPSCLPWAAHTHTRTNVPRAARARAHYKGSRASESRRSE